MITQPWQAAITRWGDPVFRLALLLTDTYAAAEEATVQAFTQTLSAEQTDQETALYTNLLASVSRRRWRLSPRLRRLLQQRASVRLPRPLMRIAGHDRALLGLWLLRDVSGTRLTRIARMPAETLVERLSETLLVLLPVGSLALADANNATDQPDLATFNAWLRRKLGLDATSPVHLGSDAQHAAETRWQAALDDLRLHLRGALESQRLPLACSQAIETNLVIHQSGGLPTWWERPAVWATGVVAGALLLLLWLILPGNRLFSADPTAQRPITPDTAQAIVQQALDLWTTQPVSGTIQRTVWAMPPTPLPDAAPGSRRQRRDQPQITDVWLEAESARYRLEVHSDNRLLEWQLGDGSRRLEYAAEPRSVTCAWGESGVLNNRSSTYEADAAAQRAVLTSRLTQGAYGQGYHALRQALAAPDLRSFGTRAEAQDLLLALSYTDRSAPSERRLLLWMDTATKELRAVQELPAASQSGAARDLWRLQQRQELPFGVPRAKPSWPQPLVEGGPLFDPTCPALDTTHIASLRMMIADDSWNTLYLPQPVPDEITRAALISTNTISEELIFLPSDARAVLIGPDHWLRISINTGQSLSRGNIQRGPWRVSLSENGADISADLCRTPSEFQGCAAQFSLAARGWSREELLALIDTLAPVNGQHWDELDELFVDPAPLDAAVRDALQNAFTATQIRSGTLHTVAERSIRTDPQRPIRTDPYHVPLDEQSPARLTEEQWRVYSGTATLQSSDLVRLPDGRLSSAVVNDGTRNSLYYAMMGMAVVDPSVSAAQFSRAMSIPTQEILNSLIQRTLPITLTAQGDALLLHQSIPEIVYTSSQTDFQVTRAWQEGLGEGTLQRRVTIDRATSLPRQMQILHIALDGRETILNELTVREWRYLEQPAPATTFQLPALPADQLVIELGQRGEPRIVVGRDIADPPLEQQLVWPADSGARIVRVQNATRTVYDESGFDRRLIDAISSSIPNLDQSGFVQSTIYEFDGSAEQVVIRQGPRTLLRHMLRHPQSSIDLGQSQPSRQISVTIAGQPRTAWLLDEPLSPALVVEVDQTLLHISGVNFTSLESIVVPRLAQLEWAPIAEN